MCQERCRESFQSEAQGGAGGRASAATGGVAPTSPSSGKLAGSTTRTTNLRSDFADHWDLITLEDEANWSSIETTRDKMNWADLDKVYEYARQRGISFQHQAFVERRSQPEWMEGLSPAEQAAELEQWMQLFCERYPDVALIDVVHETSNDGVPAYADALGGSGSSGYDWVVRAFEIADRACPNALLLLNDYDALENSKDNAHLVEVVDALKHAGAPLDAIGCAAQNLHDRRSRAEVQEFLQQLAATGLPIYITRLELDIADDAQQELIMQSTFPLFWDHSAVRGISYWAYAANDSAVGGSALITSDGRSRPALTWLMDFLDRR
jgi:endo-1,4-beta-xylanase